MIEPEFGLQVLVLLLDGPALMRRADQRPQAGRCGERSDVRHLDLARERAS
jgi:hypothetical protein